MIVVFEMGIGIDGFHSIFAIFNVYFLLLKCHIIILTGSVILCVSVRKTNFPIKKIRLSVCWIKVLLHLVESDILFHNLIVGYLYKKNKMHMAIGCRHWWILIFVV